MSETLQKVTAVVTGALVAIGAFALIASTQATAMGKQPTNQTIVDIAVANGNFSTLATALTCTDLIGLFDGSSNRQFTVFAPTDAAFAKKGLNAGNVCDVDGLAGILAYHVTPGLKSSQTVLNRSSMNMLSRQMAPIEGTTIGGAELNTSLLNLRASNGIIHVLNDVMMP